MKTSWSWSARRFTVSYRRGLSREAGVLLRSCLSAKPSVGTIRRGGRDAERTCSRTPSCRSGTELHPKPHPAWGTVPQTGIRVFLRGESFPCEGKGHPSHGNASPRRNGGHFSSGNGSPRRKCLHPSWGNDSPRRKKRFPARGSVPLTESGFGTAYGASGRKGEASPSAPERVARLRSVRSGRSRPGSRPRLVQRGGHLSGQLDGHGLPHGGPMEEEPGGQGGVQAPSAARPPSRRR
jgi:hypothetical protein